MWQSGHDGLHASKIVNDTGSLVEAGCPYQTPVRCRVPVIVIAVVPARSCPRACASASGHSDGTFALVIVRCSSYAA